MDNKTSCRDFMSYCCLECQKFSRDQWEICAGCEHNTGECVDCVSAPDCALRPRPEVVV